MSLTAGRYGLKSLIWRGTFFVIIAAFTLVFLGPAIDHHFAERQHEHSHLYLTVNAVTHGHPGLHPFEEAHSHGRSATEGGMGSSILYQTSNDGLGGSGSVSITAVIDDGRVFPLHREDSLSLVMTAGHAAYREAYIARPKRPPRS